MHHGKWLHVEEKDRGINTRLNGEGMTSLKTDRHEEMTRGSLIFLTSKEELHQLYILLNSAVRSRLKGM